MVNKKVTDKHPPIPSAVLEGIARILGDTEKGLTGPEIGVYLQEVNIQDTDPQLSKWKRLFNAFAHFQNQSQHSNNILKFVNKAMSPARFIGHQERFEDLRFELNKRLGFIGLCVGEKGGFIKVPNTVTIDEAERRASRLKSKLELRSAHPKIFEYCNAELLAENYFHTVFEAVKSIAEEIRKQSGLTEDGGTLVDRAFSISSPLIKINDLSTETHESEQKGFMNLLKGVFGMFRNTTAHAPRIIWVINEADALDILSTISLIHRRLENASKGHSPL